MVVFATMKRTIYTISWLVFVAIYWGVHCVNTHELKAINSEDASADTDSEMDVDIKGDNDTDSCKDTMDPGTEDGGESDIDLSTDGNSDLDWVSIAGGTFTMGSNGGYPQTQPVHSVTLSSFEITRTEVTSAQYEASMDASEHPERDIYLTNLPITCVTWNQAVDFCAWAGGRLPSEAEWEYAARGGGQDITYPWGDEEPTCEHVVIDGEECFCAGYTMPVCSRPLGNTANNLCDMAGNVFEWVQDWWHDSYDGAPTDGSAWEDQGVERVIRGCSYECNINDPISLRSTYRDARDAYTPTSFGPDLGFRCVR